jgi:hypothetical protein
VDDDGVDGGYWSGSWVDDGGAAKFMVLTAAGEIPRARAPVDKGQGVSRVFQVLVAQSEA